MSGRNTIVINGKVYDAVTGLPVGAPDPVKSTTSTPKAAPAAKETPAPQAAEAIKVKRQPVAQKAVHRRTQKSATLRRDILVKPHNLQTPIHKVKPMKKPADVERSPLISKFAAHPQPINTTTAVSAKQTTQSDMRAPVTPALVKKAEQRLAAKKASTRAVTTAPITHAKPAPKALKEKMISERLAAAPATHSKKPGRQKAAKRQPRIAAMLTACFAVVLLGGYFTYLNMPGLSVRVAAAQAGVDATFPDYRPSGYSLDGPVAYAPGQVKISFKLNGGDQHFILTQQKSSWNSQAVLDNYVTKKNSDYIATSEQGLTVYTFGSNAAWVNGGILYTIDGDAPLTNDQILHIAASL